LLDTRRPAAAQLALVGVFVAGVVVGAVTTTQLGGRGALVPAALIAADLAWIFSRGAAHRHRTVPPGTP
jgi:hypothetical protein